MLNLFKKKRKSTELQFPKKIQEAESPQKTLFHRLKNGLSKTKVKFSENITSALLGKKEIDEHLLEEMETCLLTADLGIKVTDEIIQNLTRSLKRKEKEETTTVLAKLKTLLTAILKPVEKPLEIAPDYKPYVILMIGVNGSGKTTSIGKLAKYLKDAGKNVMLAAGDTFRAAAIEQLQVWGERNEVPVIAQQPGADSASVIFDAIQSAKTHQIDVLIADTAGRLHTQTNLMQELKKITRVMKKIDETAPHEVMLVLDATIGQNALQQAKQFHEAIGVTGIALTKLDGTAKGGIIFAIANELGLPIRFVGVGEKIDDLQPFNAVNFVNALLA
ncbi:MAG: signal recognition particle-docking protein FtsY [Gammaproteobacteria bacterium]|nr:signal recognition particle-docking protein FtsY [Gammaproteobacteria bacterium]